MIREHLHFDCRYNTKAEFIHEFGHCYALTLLCIDPPHIYGPKISLVEPHTSHTAH